MKDDHSSPPVCDCRESSSDSSGRSRPLPEQPCETALATYRHALTAGSLPQDEVAGCLRALHLMVADRDSPGFMMPVPPETASYAALAPLQEAIADRRRTLRATRATLSVFEALYADVHRLEQPVLTRLSGETVISKALEAGAAGCREEMRTAHPGGGRPALVLQEALSRDLGNLRRGIRQRTIYQHTVRSDRTTLAYIEQVTAAGAEVRTLAEVVDRVIVFDRNLAFVPFSDEPHHALRIQHPSLVRFLARDFDEAWSRAVPVRPERAPLRTPVITSDLQRAILQAVVNGETDASIARRIGMSRRSVAEHMRKVSEQLGSNSRAQLGYLVATSGLLDG
ncbi:LuxR C-terminal-related transcriptional regulator [Streptomyces sp. RKAG290]|uniref:LuxR C-terminal-related transcriptional regulator n=1 Tax=Streptomyces sp. RKAG290 TaxID=2888348 RepID=UPI0020341E36|nr:LuxR C-terminal-related transcriptional regulator [Streptomyces sp. RKAG290]MCM2412017.1 LuxR C-terminal-related transcriptional regulator [Streptomyces sp. RKAG290]